MRRRPWPIIFLALLHILGPIGNVFLSSWVEKMAPGNYLRAFISTSTPWALVDFFLLLPLAGIAIYLCKKWSYPIFLLIAGLTVYSNYTTWAQSPDVFPAWVLVGTLLLDAAFVAYFLIPAVRTVYMDPRIRWWESKPRYTADLKAEVTDQEGLKTGTICDISEGGIFLGCEAEISPHAPVVVRFSANDHAFEIHGKVVYHRRGDKPGYGVQFSHDKSSLRATRQLIRELKKAGARSRDNVDWKEDLVTWFTTLAKTGHGLVPETQRPKTPQS